MVVGRGVRPESEFVLLGRAAQEIEDAARLHRRPLVGRVDVEDIAHVLGEVHHHRDVAALAGQACATTATEDRRAVATCRRDRFDHVFLVPRNDDADGHLAVIRRVRRIERTAAVIEAYLAAELAPQVRLQARGIDLGDRQGKSGMAQTLGAQTG